MLPILKRNSFFPSIVDEFFGKDLPGFLNLDYGISSPSVNILEGKDEFKIEVAAPGLEKEDFKINLQNNVLTISSEKESKQEEQDKKFMRREFSYMQFNRSFSLPVTANAEQINASYRHGVLTILIPKKEEAKEKPLREIEIS
jgi:HSP20 family protein